MNYCTMAVGSGFLLATSRPKSMARLDLLHRLRVINLSDCDVSDRPMLNEMAKDKNIGELL